MKLGNKIRLAVSILSLTDVYAMDVPLLPIWLEIMDSLFSLRTFTRLIIDTAKSMDCERSLDSDMICTSLSPILYHILANISMVKLRQAAVKLRLTA